MSIMSFPDRGSWGNSKWRGNCSGHVYRELFERLRPSVFIDPMVGSGTSVEVAKEMGIEAYGLDLHSGFNAASSSILKAIGKPADLCVSHPPYGAMIVYSGNVWGEANAHDLSRCKSDDDFHEKMQLVLLNQREATKPGGFYGTIIGDWRRNGIYTSYQAEMIARMPKNELAGVIIKAQHNCTSDRQVYGKMKLPLILHEYILLWQKKTAPILIMLRDVAAQQYERLRGTWKSIVKLALIELGGSAILDDLYEKVSNGAEERIAQNPNWKAKIRQVLNQNPSDFQSISRGNWALA